MTMGTQVLPRGSMTLGHKSAVYFIVTLLEYCQSYGENNEDSVTLFTFVLSSGSNRGNVNNSKDSTMNNFFVLSSVALTGSLLM